MSILAGKTILVVEDEPIVAMLVEDMLAELGANPIGPATSLAGALELAGTATFDAAILDVNLNGERSDRVAAVLREREIPFIFATGYGSTGAGDFGHSGVIEKPFQIAQMSAALIRALDL